MEKLEEILYDKGGNIGFKLKSPIDLYDYPCCLISICIEKNKDYAGRIMIYRDIKRADARSIIEILCMAIGKDTEIRIEAEKEKGTIKVLKELYDLFENSFYEGNVEKQNEVMDIYNRIIEMNKKNQWMYSKIIAAAIKAMSPAIIAIERYFCNVSLLAMLFSIVLLAKPAVK